MNKMIATDNVRRSMLTIKRKIELGNSWIRLNPTKARKEDYKRIAELKDILEKYEEVYSYR